MLGWAFILLDYLIPASYEQAIFKYGGYYPYIKCV